MFLLLLGWSNLHFLFICCSGAWQMLVPLASGWVGVEVGVGLDVCLCQVGQ